MRSILRAFEIAASPALGIGASLTTGAGTWVAGSATGASASEGEERLLPLSTRRAATLMGADVALLADGSGCAGF